MKQLTILHWSRGRAFLLLICLFSLEAKAGSGSFWEALTKVPRAKPWSAKNPEQDVQAEAEADRRAEEEARRKKELALREQHAQMQKQYSEWRESAGRAAKSLDQVAKKVEEYGIISMSAPVLAGPRADFTFNLTRDEDDYFKAAKEETEVAVGSAERIVQSFSARASVAQDQLALEKYQSDKEQFEDHAAAKDLVLKERLKGAESRYKDAVSAANALTDPAKKAEALTKARADYEKEYSDAVNARHGTTPPSFPTSGTPATANDAQTVTQAGAGVVEQIKAASNAAVEAIKAAAAAKTGTPANDFSQTTVNLSGVPAPAIDPVTGLPRANEARGVLEAITNMNALNAVRQADLQTPDRAALIQTAGNRAVHAIFEFLGDPNTANQFRDKQVMFGVTTVGVSPGWRTQKDFAADVAIQVSYEYQLARYDTIVRLVNDRRYPKADREALAKPLGILVTDSVTMEDGVTIKEGGSAIVNHGGAIFTSIGHSTLSDAANELANKKPVVSGVSPLMDTQVSDLESQWRRQDEFALMLSAMFTVPGAKGSGGAFEQYVKNRQSDARSRTASGVVNTYSAAGGLFGFQVGPRLQALADPATKKAGQGRVLERQSFPAAIIFGLDHNDIRPVICKNGDGRLVVYEPVIKLVQTTRWTNLMPRFIERFVLWKPSTWTRARWSEENRLKGMLGSTESLSVEANKAPRYHETGGDIATDIDNLIGERFDHYSYLVGGASTTLSIPAATLMPNAYQIGAEAAAEQAAEAAKKAEEAALKARRPQVSKFIPEDIKMLKGVPVEVVLKGQNLDLVVPKSIVVKPGKKLRVEVIVEDSTDRALVLKVSLDGGFEHAIQNFGAGLELNATTGGKVFSPLLNVDIPVKVEKEATAAPAAPGAGGAGGGGGGAAMTPAKGPPQAVSAETPEGAESALVSNKPLLDDLDAALLLLPTLPAGVEDSAQP